MEKIRVFELLKLAASIVICLCAGFIGSIFTNTSLQTWYIALKKPSFNPPNWIFAPVWTTLFLLMGISMFLVWRKGLADQKVRTALIMFAVQFIFNILWSLAFFGFRSPLAGLAVIVILWAAILLTILSFYRISTAAAILLIPYISWVSFAAVLNTAIFIINQGGSQ